MPLSRTSEEYKLILSGLLKDSVTLEAITWLVSDVSDSFDIKMTDKPIWDELADVLRLKGGRRFAEAFTARMSQIHAESNK